MTIRKVRVNLSFYITMLFGLVVAEVAHAITYSATLDNSSWQVQSSMLECKLSQSIPRLGSAVFQHKAGDDLLFYLDASLANLELGSASLVAGGSAWKVNSVAELIADIDITIGDKPVQVAYPKSNQILNSLNKGMEITINVDAEKDASIVDDVKVVISTINFNNAYQKYLTCMAQLLPVNFAQIARSAIFFDTNNASLSEEVEQNLALIALYVIADKRIDHVIIDGHTDNVGNKRINRNLSKRRANIVAAFFKKAGVSKKLIKIRYHADKYPVLTNNTEGNRARNRRVTIRLKRE